MLLDSEHSDNYVSLFQGMSKGEEVKMEKFFCQLYGIKDAENVDSGRVFKLFSLAGAKLTSSGLTEPKLRSKVRKGNCSLLPPITMLQGSKPESSDFRGHNMYPCYGLERSEYGWEKVEGMWCPTWYHGSSLPEKLDGRVPE